MRVTQRLLLVACAAFFLRGSFAAELESWRLVTVPGPVNLARFAWFRSWVKVPDSYFAAHERNLFEESVGVFVRDLAGAHQLYVNGLKVGQGGAFPPEYHNGQGTFYRHKVPVGTLRKGAWNEIAIRVYQPPDSGAGGFLGEAPFIMDYFTECVFEGAWQFRLGNEYQPGGALTERPAAATFDKFQESNRTLSRAAQVHGPSLSPAESAAKMRPAPDLKTELLLSEPLVAQPTHFSFDARGRLWVAQYRQYPYPAGLTMLSRDKYYRAHYDKVPPAPPDHDRGADIISIHEDTNGDGVYDRHKVFLHGLNMANAVVSGHGGVWVMHTPYLLFYRDLDGDDVPDGPPEVRLAGFGFEDTHSVANGLVWGPDGWLYGAQGSTTSCRVTRPGTDAPDSPGVYFEGCMVWRYHPETRAFELFAEGGGNTFGLEVDAHGRLYSGHNGGGTRGWHFVQGGFYEMQGRDPGKFGPPRNPYGFGVLPMMRTTNNAVRFTHFGAFAEGTAMPRNAQGLLFALDPLHNVVVTSEVRRRGSTFETFDREPALRSEDETFRPLYIANAPDGSLFVSDMCEYYIAHGQHYQNQIDPTTGRIYRLRGKDEKLEQDTNLRAKTPDELVALLSHPNKWHRQTAVRLLGEGKPVEVLPKLRTLIAENAGLGALHGLWALYQITRFDGEDESVKKALKHSYAPVRLWAVRLLGDEYGVNRGLGVGDFGRSADASLPSELYKGVLTQARAEHDPEVISQLASTARRLKSAQALELVRAVMEQPVAQDPFIPLLCWWVFEAHIPEANDQILKLFEDRSVWDLAVVFNDILPRLGRRYAVEGKHSDLLRLTELFRGAPGSKHAAQLLQGLEEAFRGRSVTSLPHELISAASKAGALPLVFRVKQGDAAAVQEALRIAANATAKPEERLAMVRMFGEVRNPNAVPTLLEIASSGSNALRKVALAALSSYDDEQVGGKVIELLPSLKSDVQLAAYALLASRTAWSLRLLDAVQSGKVKRSQVPEEVADRLRESKDKQVSQLAVGVLPRTRIASPEHQKRIDEIKAILQRAPGNPYAGEATFTTRCAICHKLFFKGGNVGPELTAYQRDNLSTMLPSIVNPNAEIREGYQYYTVETKDGRSLSGFFVDRDNQVTVLRGLNGENITLRAEEIQELQPVGRSLMPEGLLDGMTDQELRDFFAYLRISQPISN